MSSLAIAALMGELKCPLFLGELAELMAHQTLGTLDPARLREAEAVIRQLGVKLTTRKRQWQEEVPGALEVFKPWDRERDSPLECNKIDPETGRAGRWVHPDRQISGPGQSAPEGRRRPSTFVTRTETKFHPEDVGEVLKGPIGKVLEREGWVTGPLKAWCEAAGARVEKAMKRRDLAEAFEFLRADDKAGPKPYDDIGELARKGSQGQLCNADGVSGMFYPSEVGAAAERMGWKMRAKSVRGSVGTRGALALQERWVEGAGGE